MVGVLRTLRFVVVVTAGLSGALVYPSDCVPRPPGCIAWWTFDEESGQALDSIGNQHAAPVNGASRNSGMVDGAAQFDGRDDYFAAPDSDLWAFGKQDFTIELWARFDAPGSGSVSHPGDIFIGNDEGSGLRRKWFFALGGGVLNFHINAPDIGPRFFPRVPFQPVVGQWYHLAVTREGSTYGIWVDGELMGTAQESSPVPNANAPLTIGQAEGLGYMNGRLDEVAIYDRALGPWELAAIVGARSAGKCKGLDIENKRLEALEFGRPSSQELRASRGRAPFSWSLASGALPVGVSLSEDGVLAGTPEEVGEFKISIRVEDAVGQTAERSFVLQVLATLPPPKVRAYRSGTMAVPGQAVDYFILVENEGDVEAKGYQILDLLDPRRLRLLSVDPPGALDISTMRDLSAAIWVLDLAPGEAKLLHLQALLSPSTAVGTTLRGSTFGGEDLLRNYMECLLAASNVLECARCATLCASCVPACEAGPWTCIGCLALCAHCVLELPDCAGSAHEFIEHCLVVPLSTFLQEVFGAYDPNEIVVVPSGYVRPGQLLTHSVRFENLGNAAARDVRVAIPLDENLDLATLEVLGPSGDWRAMTDGHTEVLREEEKERRELVIVGDREIEVIVPYTERWLVTRRGPVLEWELSGIFLEPGETAQVSYKVRARDGLASGTELRARAEVRFDLLDPVLTNEAVTTIDATPPVAWVDPLPRHSLGLEFPISWSGIDQVGEIDWFTVFVSVDGGPYRPLLSKTRERTATFRGAVGKKYSFLCIAGDTAGNVEVSEPVAEAETEIPAGLGRAFVRGDSNGDGSLNIADPVALLNYLFLGGEKVACLDAADANDDGGFEPDVSDAVYILNYLFRGGPRPADPYPACGLDPTPDDLECARSACEVGPENP